MENKCQVSRIFIKKKNETNSSFININVNFSFTADTEISVTSQIVSADNSKGLIFLLDFEMNFNIWIEIFLDHVIKVLTAEVEKLKKILEFRENSNSNDDSHVKSLAEMTSILAQKSIQILKPIPCNMFTICI